MCIIYIYIICIYKYIYHICIYIYIYHIYIYHIYISYIYICYICIIFIYMATDRIMGKKNVQLRQAAPASDFSIIGFFPIRVQKKPEVIRTFFFHNSWRWPLFP